jgi:hypothetical protein
MQFRLLFRAAFVLGTLVLNSGAALAEQPRDALLDHMVGRWVLQGTIAGGPTTHDIDAGWVLANGYVRFHEVSREKDAQGGPKYEAIVLIGYDRAKSHYVCFWFDVTGVASPDTGAVAQREGDTLPFVFKDPSGDFHTTFAYDAKNDTWTWRMDGEEKGKLQPFARVTLSRR